MAENTLLNKQKNIHFFEEFSDSDAEFLGAFEESALSTNEAEDSQMSRVLAPIQY